MIDVVPVSADAFRVMRGLADGVFLMTGPHKPTCTILTITSRRGSGRSITAPGTLAALVGVVPGGPDGAGTDEVARPVGEFRTS